MIEFSNVSQSKHSKKFFTDIANKILKKDYLLSVVFLSKKEIQQVNKKYRKKDKPTDVLSFENKESDFPDKFIGEIMICPDVVRENAKEYKVSYKTELKRMFVHGILHLLGYDHINSKDAKEMKKQEDKHIV